MLANIWIRTCCLIAVLLAAIGCDISPNTRTYRFPTMAEVHYQAGLALTDDGHLEEAIEKFDLALQLDPNRGDWYRSRSYARYEFGDHAGAVADLNEAIRREPENYAALNTRGWLLATSPNDEIRDGHQAVQDAEKACQLTDFEEAAYVDTLAAAHAELGNFDEAVKWQEKAAALALEGQKQDFESRLELYESGKAYREELNSDVESE